jgi:hypothetical protein
MLRLRLSANPNRNPRIMARQGRAGNSGQYPNCAVMIQRLQGENSSFKIPQRFQFMAADLESAFPGLFCSRKWLELAGQNSSFRFCVESEFWFEALGSNVQDNRTRPSRSPTEAAKLKTHAKPEKEPKGGFRLIVELDSKFTTERSGSRIFKNLINLGNCEVHCTHSPSCRF